MELGPVHHVSINVPKVSDVAPFYTEVLGMTELDRPDFGSMDDGCRRPAVARST